MKKPKLDSDKPDKKMDDLGKLFSPKSSRGEGVTISPVKSKDAPLHQGPASGGAVGSVTITKLSTGSSLNVPSKDLNKILGAESTPSPAASQPSSSGSSSSSSANSEPNGFKSGAKFDVVPLSKNAADDEKESKTQNEILKCGKCREVFSTKEAKRLHTCNSILDQRFLTETKTQQGEGKTSRSPSPSVKELKGKPAFSVKEKQLKCKLIRDSKDELHIEGRPKLSIVKVPRPDGTLTAASATTSAPTSSISILPETKGYNPLSKGKPAMPKLKLPIESLKKTPSAKVKSSEVKSGQQQQPQMNKKPFSGGKPLLKPADNNQESVVKRPDAEFTGKKLKIKLGGSTAPVSSESSNESVTAPKNEPSETTTEKPADESFQFAFVGRPTYSPSRISDPPPPTSSGSGNGTTGSSNGNGGMSTNTGAPLVSANGTTMPTKGRLFF